MSTVPYRPPPEAATRADVTTDYPGPVTRPFPGTVPVIKNYELLQEIKGGGMGIVYKARHKASGRIEALKTIRPELASGEHLDRFTREVRTLAGLAHANIIRIYHVGLDEEPPYYTMEFLAGGTLLGQRARYTANPSKAAEVMEKISRAVQDVHERGIYHRDLKPGNVLMTEDGEPIVTDFGLAKLREADVQLTRTGAALGTPAYMSPEQFQGRTDIGAATDIWALGVMLYELLTGKRPFEGGSTVEVQHKVLDSAPLGVRQHNASIDPVLERIVNKCLVKEPDWRFRSAGELAEHLKRWREKDPIPLERESAVRKARRWIRRHPRSRNVLAFLVLTAVSACGLYVYMDPERSQKNELRQGNPVELFSNGHPRYHHWLGSAGGIGMTRIDGHLEASIQGWDCCELELLSDPQSSRYRFSADMAYRSASPIQSEGGIIFGAKAKSGRHVVWSVLLNYRPPMGMKPGAVSEPMYQCHVNVRVFRDQPDGIARHQLAVEDLPNDKTGPSAWHHIDVNVADTAFRVLLDGKLVLDATPEFIAQQLKLLREAINNDAEKTLLKNFNPRGGLGLYIAQGEAAFRNVLVTPSR